MIYRFKLNSDKKYEKRRVISTILKFGKKINMDLQ